MRGSRPAAGPANLLPSQLRHRRGGDCRRGAGALVGNTPGILAGEPRQSFRWQRQAIGTKVASAGMKSSACKTHACFPMVASGTDPIDAECIV
jgi:hypothetical protein